MPLNLVTIQYFYPLEMVEKDNIYQFTIHLRTSKETQKAITSPKNHETIQDLQQEIEWKIDRTSSNSKWQIQCIKSTLNMPRRMHIGFVRW